MICLIIMSRCTNNLIRGHSEVTRFTLTFPNKIQYILVYISGVYLYIHVRLEREVTSEIHHVISTYTFL